MFNSMNDLPSRKKFTAKNIILGKISIVRISNYLRKSCKFVKLALLKCYISLFDILQNFNSYIV